jgi:hypothetical protein
MSSTIGSSIMSFLMGQSLYSSELQSLGMALQANLIVHSRYGSNNSSSSSSSSNNKESSSSSSSTYFWFYRFVQSVLIGYSGGIFGTIFLGKPCPFLLNDIHMTSCLVSFLLVQIILPYIMQLLRQSIFSNDDSSISTFIYSAITIPLQMMITMYAQLFRSMGLMKFITVCHIELLVPPYHTIATKYYTIPIFGPIIYGTMLGNMGGFILNGIDGYTQRSGIPYPFQNGNVFPGFLCVYLNRFFSEQIYTYIHSETFLLFYFSWWLFHLVGIFCGTFYHFYVHDTTGIIGTTLRNYLQPFASSLLELLGWDDYENTKNSNDVFATVMVSLFMQIVAILQMPIFFGPTFSPFVVIYNQIVRFLAPFPSPSHHEVVNDTQNGSIVKRTKNSTKKDSSTVTTTKKATSVAKDKKL